MYLNQQIKALQRYEIRIIETMEALGVQRVPILNDDYLIQFIDQPNANGIPAAVNVHNDVEG